MKLLIDIGNSRIKWALASDDHTLMGSGWSSQVTEFKKDLIRISPEQAPEKCLIVAVGEPSSYTTIALAVEEQWSLQPQRFQSQAEQAGVVNAYSDITTLGADRWAALIATHHLFKKSTLIADCGSAVTLDVLEAEGVHRGGYILPGLQMMRTALHEKAALPVVSNDRHLKIANNTQDGIGAGSKLGIIAAIEHVARAHVGIAGKPLHVVLTGGDAEQIGADLQIPFSHIPDLVLKGLAFSTEAE